MAAWILVRCHSEPPNRLRDLARRYPGLRYTRDRDRVFERNAWKGETDGPQACDIAPVSVNYGIVSGAG